MKVIYLNCGLRCEYESDLRSNEHYLSSSEKAWKKIQACTGSSQSELYAFFSPLLK